ncbi:MAG: right-handed parallel beta-helix repeat-containing protein [Sedimentisphaerales bacterium]|nr:right-handed parallel beta-helix repeat-containing protein [Sedimentisphaerales bacterium]
MTRWGDKENRGGTFEFQGNRSQRWKTADQLWLHGYWFHDWADEAIKVEHIDTEKKQITFATPHGYGLKQDQRYYALNLLEEVDSPGEWFLDRKEKILYFWPPDNFDKANVQLSLLRTPLLELKDASQVLIVGLIFEVSGGSAISIQGGDENLIAGSSFRNLGTSAISISLGRHNGVVSCDIYNIGSTGISLSGGDRKTLTPAEHYALNNHIHHFAQRKKTYRPAISLNGVGNRMAHNLIHNAPHAAVLYGGNEHIMEYNDVHSVCLETSDVGVFYCGRNWTIRGNEVRYNYFHDIPSLPGHGSMTIYLDDSASSTRIFGNIFYRTRYSAFIGGGRDNIVQNNIFIECDKPIHIDSRGIGWAAKYQKKGASHRMYEKLEEVNYDKPPWSTRYPKLARILDENPHEPRGNIIIENVSVRSSWQDPDKRWARLENNFLTSDDPGFVDYSIRDFRLKKDSLVYQKIPGFKPIPFEKIGLYQDQHRSLATGNN